VAFFPLYPYLIRLVHYAIPLQSDAGWLLVGIIVSNAALLAALIYLYRLMRFDYDRPTAGRVVLYLCVFPTTPFLSAVYSESLFLALVVAAFYYARADRWFIVGGLSAAAALCRPPGVLLIVALAVEYLCQKEFQWQRVKADCLALLLAPLALIGHLTFLRWRFGDWNILSEAETMQGWNRQLTLPWNTLFRSLPDIYSFKGFHGAFEFFFTLALLGLVIFCCFRLRLSYSIYAAASLVFITSWGELRSAPRFGLVIFPVMIGLALLGENKVFNRMCLVVCALLATVSMVVFSQWGWVA
jgi:Gpi18-like mannosyltransferase